MKHHFRKILALGLCAVLTAALLPAAFAATPQQLRQTVAAHTKAVASVETKLETRRFNDSRLPDDRKELMRSVGARASIYYEYSRHLMVYRGPITEYNSVSLEAYKAQLVDGFLPASGTNVYRGMNANSFVTDVLSRVIPTPILGVKDALTAEGLTPLFSGVDLTAASSKEAAAGVSYTAAMDAYGKLGLGDILLAWDDAADGHAMPRLHAMVITSFDTQNRGLVTVTYPACANAVYHFTCSRCGEKSVEKPNGAVISKHMVSANYKFSRFMKHNETYPDSACTGEWLPEGGTTWATETLSFDQLFGYNGASVPGGSICYLPYTIDAFVTGKPVKQEIKVTTDATAENIASGFKAKVESNYRIVRVDAVVSQPGKEDLVFTNYPEWDDWSYEYENAALDKVLFEGQTGEYTLTLLVHSGPLDDPADLVVPVTEGFRLDLQLTDPSFQVVVNKEAVHQGESVVLITKSIAEGLTGTRVTISCDTDRFAFNRADSERANPGAKFVENANGTVTVSWFGPAAKGGQELVKTYFTAVRTGVAPLTADQVQAFGFSYAGMSKKAGAAEADLLPTRVGGGQPRVGVGLNLAVYKDYAPGYDLVLAMVQQSEANATYAGQAMLDISATNWEVDGKGFSHVYAYVAANADPELVAVEYTGMSFNKDTSYRRVKFNMDVNRDGGVDIADVKMVSDIIGGALSPVDNMEAFLVADVDHSGKVDLADARAVMAAVK